MPNKSVLFYTSLILLLIFAGYLVISVSSYSFLIIPEASAISEDDALKGLGVAVLLYLVSRIGSSRAEPDVDVSEPVTDFNEEEKDLFVRLISAEARGEPKRGQVAVGAVIINRIESTQFPNNLLDVVYQDRQFTPIRDGSINHNPSHTAYEAAIRALEGEDPSGEALYFYNPETARTMEWFEQNTTMIKQIGNHVFAR